MSDKKVALITGANKGIGYETAKILGQKGITVYIGSRNMERGLIAEKQLKELGIDAYAIHIDLDAKDTIVAVADRIKKEHGLLDILINNAGIIDPADSVPSTTDIKVVKRTFETNFFAAIEVTQAMLPLLRRAKAARVVNLSSGLGSLALNEDPEWEFASTKLIGYNASKAALNMLTIQLAWELRETSIKVNSANPGYTDTELVPGVVGAQPVELGAQTPVRLALLPDDGPTGGFFENEGDIPW